MQILFWCFTGFSVNQMEQQQSHSIAFFSYFFLSLHSLVIKVESSSNDDIFFVDFDESFIRFDKSLHSFVCQGQLMVI